MKRIIILHLAFLILNLNVHADIIYLNKGEEYEGKLISIERDSIFFKATELNQIKKWANNDVQRIEFEEPQKIQDIKTLGDKLLDSLWTMATDISLYPNAAWVTLYEKVSYLINPDSSYTKSVRKIQKLLRPRGKRIANLAFPYLSKSQKLELKVARTIDLTGEVRYLKESAKKDESIYSTSPAYENLHRVRIALPSLKLGGISDVQIVQEFAKASLEHPFFIEECFRDYEPILYKIVEIFCPQDIELSIFKAEEIKSEVIAQGNTKIYSFSREETKEIEREPHLPILSDFVPRIGVSFKNDWQLIGNEYYKLISSRLKYSPELKDKIRELKSVREIYNFVATEIKAVPIFRLSQYSWLPRSLDNIFKNKFGSLLDKTFLLYGMLRERRLPVYIVLTSEDKRIPETPSIGQFSAIVLALKEGDKFTYLSPWSDCVAFGELPNKYQGKLGLLIDSKHSRFGEVTSFKPEEELTSKKIYVTLDTLGDIKVKQVTKLYGNFAQDFRHKKSLRKKELRKYFEKFVSGIYPGAELIDFEVTELADLNKPVTYELIYKIPNYALVAKGKFLVFKLPDIKYTAEEVGRPTRYNPFDFKQRLMKEHKIEIELPKGYEIYYLPPNYFCDSDIISYEAGFEKHSPNFLQKLFRKKTKIVFKDIYKRKLSKAGQEKYQDYKRCIETRAKLSREWIVLKKQ
ncbi:DUF3857 domain-containing protein [candidate division WOR-3 bacterium]|nr:DUF3857 domain-containing protein [candidate division WOR-3 bacterium]